MSDNNYVPDDKLYPWTHPDEFEVVFKGLCGDTPYPVITYDTLLALNNDKNNWSAPFQKKSGNLVVARINESYQGQTGRIIIYYAAEYQFAADEEVIEYVEMPLRNGYFDNNGDGTQDSWVDGGAFETADGTINLPQEAVPAAEISSALILDTLVRENEKTEGTADVDEGAQATRAAAPAAAENTSTRAAASAALAPAAVYDQATVNAALANPALETAIRNGFPPGASAEIQAAFGDLADEFAALTAELATNPALTRVSEITTRLDAITKELPASLAGTATLISNAIAPVLNPGNIAGLTGILDGATKLANGFIKTGASVLTDITKGLDLVAGTTIQSLSNIGQSLEGVFKEVGSTLSGVADALKDGIPNLNDLFKFDPKVLFNKLNLGAVAKSIASLDLAAIGKEIAGGIIDVVDQLAALFGPIGRSLANIPELQALRRIADAGFGYDGARGHRSGHDIRQIDTRTPVDNNPAPTGTPYQRLIRVMNASLTQDWKPKSTASSGQRPSERDPRADDRIPDPPEGANPLIMEAYRLSGQNDFTRDGDTGEYSWHTAFVNYVLSKAGLPIVVSMSAQAYYSYGNRVNHTNMGRNNVAKKGDIVIFNSRTGGKYIGFYWGFDKEKNKIKVLGGNQENVGVQVIELPFSLTNGDFYVTHVRRNWEITEIESESTVDNVDDIRAERNASGIHPTSGPTSRGGRRAWTPEDAAEVEAIRRDNEILGGGLRTKLTPGQRAYANSKGYLQTNEEYYRKRSPSPDRPGENQ